jgi:hypothetical protein
MLDHLLTKLDVHQAAHGFCQERSIVSNATPHVGAGVVVNVDLRDFFPTVTYARVKGVFRALGYGEQVATLFALLATEPDTEEVELDGRRWFVAAGPRKLPQGAPTSPAITNLICRRLDRRLAGAAAKLGFSYTRYADDLTFSARSPEGDGARRPDVGRMLRRVRWIVGLEGFAPHEKKTRVLRRGRRQEVTGVVVNDELGVERATLRKFRALLFQIDKDGPSGKRWGALPDVFASALGFASYVAMVSPAKGAPLVARVRALAARHGWQAPRKPVPAPAPAAAPVTALSSAEPPSSTASSPEPPPETPEPPPKKKWWKIF